ncbi:MAG: heavy metal-responsive transcriptional regulator [Planctomycetia bacterium]|nr:heavy metal-responsive transcriptional regulator [Planctomycetia bacterium]
MQTLTIGQIARETGLGVETVRFYEREGLLEKPARSPSGYRQYQPEAIARLRFIKQAQRLGFALREVKELLELKLDPLSTRSQVKDRATAKIADIDHRIDELRRMKQALVPLVQACDGKGKLQGCPILNAIENSQKRQETPATTGNGEHRCHTTITRQGTAARTRRSRIRSAE